VALAELLDMAVVLPMPHDVCPTASAVRRPSRWAGAGEALEAMPAPMSFWPWNPHQSGVRPGWNYSVINPQTRIVQVGESDPLEIGRKYTPWRGRYRRRQGRGATTARALRNQFTEGRPNPTWRGEVRRWPHAVSRLRAEIELTGGAHDAAAGVSPSCQALPRVVW